MSGPSAKERAKAVHRANNDIEEEQAAVQAERDRCARAICVYCHDDWPFDATGSAHALKEGGSIMLAPGECKAVSSGIWPRNEVSHGHAETEAKKR